MTNPEALGASINDACTLPELFPCAHRIDASRHGLPTRAFPIEVIPRVARHGGAEPSEPVASANSAAAERAEL